MVYKDKKDKKERKRNERIFGFLLLFLLGAAALVVAVLAYTQQRDGLGALRSSTNDLQGNLTHLQMENSLLQSQLVEISMHTSNETILQEGTFVWSVGGTRNRYPGAPCYNLAVTGFALDSPGSGYRVGDLVTVENVVSGPSTYLFYENPVLKVTSIGGLGDVQSFDMLTPGCLLASSTGNETMPTISIVGTGFTVKRYVGPYPPINTNTYFVFQTPQNDPVAPLQYANYSLRQVTIESVAYTVLYLYPPEFPIVLSSSSISLALTVALYEFEPLIPELQALGAYYYVLPLTKKNYNAISLPDDTNCLATNPNCWLDTYGGSSRDSPQAFSLLNSRDGFDLQVANHYFYWHFTSTAYTHDYVANNAVLTLNYPFMLVLPSL